MHGQSSLRVKILDSHSNNSAWIISVWICAISSVTSGECFQITVVCMQFLIARHGANIFLWCYSLAPRPGKRLILTFTKSTIIQNTCEGWNCRLLEWSRLIAHNKDYPWWCHHCESLFYATLHVVLLTKLYFHNFTTTLWFVSCNNSGEMYY